MIVLINKWELGHRWSQVGLWGTNAAGRAYEGKRVSKLNGNGGNEVGGQVRYGHGNGGGSQTKVGQSKNIPLLFHIFKTYFRSILSYLFFLF